MSPMKDGSPWAGHAKPWKDRRSVAKPGEMCPKCGAVHEPGRCMAHNKQGRACGKRAVPGLAVCRVHGGGNERAVRAARRRVVRAAAEEDLRQLGVPVETTPLDALEQLLFDAFGNVAVLREEASRVDLVELDGDGDEVRGSEVLRLYGEWSDRAARIAKDLVGLGLDERRVKLAEGQVQRLFGAVSRAVAMLPPEVQEQVRVRLVEELRASPMLEAG